MVLNANVGFHNLQFLYILLNLFDNCKTVKPIAIYPIRISYWILCTGFKRQKLQGWNLIEVLQEVLTSARGLSPDDLEWHFDNVYYLGNAFPVSGNTYKLEIAKMIAVKWGGGGGGRIIGLMNPVWHRQRESKERESWKEKSGQFANRGRIADALAVSSIMRIQRMNS